MTDDLDTLERDPGDGNDARGDDETDETDEPRGNQPWAKALPGDEPDAA
jgi:hypothetical protein